MSDPSSSTSSPNNKQEALLRVLKATTQLSAQVTFYAAALGAILLIPGAQLPPALAVVAGGVGVNALSSLLERVARGEDVADEEIRRQVQAAINESKIAELLNRDEFQETIAQLRSWQNLLKYTIFRSEETIISRLVEQSQQYTTLVNELRDTIAEDLEKLATREQSEEIRALLRQLADEKPSRHASSQTSYGDYSAVAGPGGTANVNIHYHGGEPASPPSRLTPHPQFRRRLSIFVASPGDVRDERERVHRIVEEMNQPGALADQYGLTLQVLDWRNAIPGAGRPETVILNQLQLESWDIFIGVLWYRFGSPTGGQDPATGRFYDSGTEEEFRLAYRAWQETGRPHILTYQRTSAPTTLSDIVPEQLTKVQSFWKEFGPDGQHPGLFQQYETPDNFERRVRGDLIKLLAKLK